MPYSIPVILSQAIDANIVGFNIKDLLFNNNQLHVDMKLSLNAYCVIGVSDIASAG
jgi:hypothetical protein